MRSWPLSAAGMDEDAVEMPVQTCLHTQQSPSPIGGRESVAGGSRPLYIDLPVSLRSGVYCPRVPTLWIRRCQRCRSIDISQHWDDPENAQADTSCVWSCPICEFTGYSVQERNPFGRTDTAKRSPLMLAACLVRLSRELGWLQLRRVTYRGKDA
jgi:hypothetical protein